MSSARYTETENMRSTQLYQPPPTTELQKEKERKRLLAENEKLELRSKTKCGKRAHFGKNLFLFVLEGVSIGLSLNGNIGLENLIVNDPNYETSLETVRSSIKFMNIAIICFAAITSFIEVSYMYINLFLDYLYLFKAFYEGSVCRSRKKCFKRILELISFGASVFVTLFTYLVAQQVKNGYSPATVDECYRSFYLQFGSFFAALLFDLISAITDCKCIRIMFQEAGAITRFVQEAYEAAR